MRAARGMERGGGARAGGGRGRAGALQAHHEGGVQHRGAGRKRGKHGGGRRIAVFGVVRELLGVEDAEERLFACGKVAAQCGELMYGRLSALELGCELLWVFGVVSRDVSADQTTQLKFFRPQKLLDPIAIVRGFGQEIFIRTIQ